MPLRATLADHGSRFFSHVPGATRFGVVGILGLVVNQVALLGLTEAAGYFYLLSALFATFVSTTFNFLLIELWVFPSRRERRLPRYLAFAALNLTTNLVLRLPLMFVAVEMLGMHYLVANVLTLALTFVLRYAFAERWIWAGRDRPFAIAHDGWYDYDLHGLVGVRSQVLLPELSAFNVTLLEREPDITVRQHLLLGGAPWFRVRDMRRRGELISYREAPGVMGAAFSLRQLPGGRFELDANWLLVASNHMLYTNMVEPMLRFVLAARGYFMLHGASLATRHGLVLSAPTDTGKTGTVLRLLSDHRASFIGDDMVILKRDGTLLGFPKPMTISSHTMAALPRSPHESQADRIMLNLRSRLHSKSGRSTGQALGRLPLPIVTMNALVQWLVPPPKYFVQSLIDDVEVTSSSHLQAVALLGRGEHLVSRPTHAELLEEMMRNTEDAYTFPPFADLSAVLDVDGQTVDALRARERAVLAAALKDATTLRINVPDFSWAQQLTELLNLPHANSAVPADTTPRVLSTEAA